MDKNEFGDDVTLKNDASIANSVPKNVSKAIYIDHFSVIINKLAILGMSFCLFAVIGQIITFVAVGVGFMLFITFLLTSTICTVGIVLLSEEFRKLWGYVKDFDQITNKLMTFFDYIVAALPYVSVATIALSITSIICFSKNKIYKHTARTVWAWISAVVAVITLVFVLVGGLQHE